MDLLKDKTIRRIEGYTDIAGVELHFNDHTKQRINFGEDGLYTLAYVLKDDFYLFGRDYPTAPCNVQFDVHFGSKAINVEYFINDPYRILFCVVDTRSKSEAVRAVNYVDKITFDFLL